MPTRSATARLFVVAVLTGIGAGIGGAALTLLLHGIQHLAFGYTENTFLIGVEQASGTRRVLVLALAGLVAGAGWLALRRYAQPIPTVVEAARCARRLPFGVTTLDACLQIVVVALGASLGREGAPRQLGAALGDWLAEWTGLDADRRRALLACGAGAGLAAVYNVPLGGAVFALEVLLISISVQDVLLALMCSAIATAVAWLVLPDVVTYQVGPVTGSGTLLAWSVLAGPILGLLATGFVQLTDSAVAHRPHRWQLPVATVTLFTALGGISVGFPQLLGNGKGAAQLAFDGRLPLTTLAALALLKPVVTAACLGSGAKGGRLTPAVATGALLGALAGRGWLQMWPGGSIAGFAIVGGSAFLAVTLTAPITAIVLLLEFTGTGGALLVPVMLATAGASVTSYYLRAAVARRTHRRR